MHYSLIDLRVFVAIADAGSVSRGAANCFLSPSSASLRIKSLEDTLKVRLFERLPRGVALTRPGQVLLEHSRRCLAELEQMHANLAPYAAGVKGHVTVFANTTAIASFLPGNLTKFLQERPSVRVNLEERLSRDIIAAIVEGRADIGVVTWEGEHPDLAFELYRKDELVIAAPREVEIAEREAARFIDCLSYPFVSLLNGSALHTYLQSKASILGHHVDARIQVASYGEVITMVRAGIGLSIIPRSVTERADLTGLKLIKLDESWSQREQRICWRKGPQALSEHAARLVDRLCGRIPE